jgi:predicted nucleic acid-binding protein
MVMTDFLLDTNIISELTKPAPDQGVVEFVAGLSVAWLSVITLHELEYGIGLLPAGKRQQTIQRAVDDLVQQFGSYILPLEQREAQQAAAFRRLRKQQGKVLHLADALIAGTAQVHRLTVVTRNSKDFDGLGIGVFDSFDIGTKS